MSTQFRDLMSALPEVYQTIYDHPEWDGDASRDCNERLEKISQVYDALASKLGRPLRVLDLGCAQGFFSLSLASKGATVKGVDFLKENIDVCKALANEHPDFSISFAVGRIEDVIEQIEPNQYDLAIGLSVFHHVIHQHGVAQVKTWIKRLSDSIHGLILELALKEEPLYWGPSQPDDPRELIEQCDFYLQLATFDTHLSKISRPMYVISNDYLIIGDYCQPFEQYSSHPYAESGVGHRGSRRYYFNKDAICKIYYFTTRYGDLLPHESARNRAELNHEIAFLRNPPLGFPAPRLVHFGQDEIQGWLVMERLPGKLLMDKIKQGESFDIEILLDHLLQQLVILEQHGLYHDDVRTWNILIDDANNAHIIDYGSITPAKQDCVWPKNIFQSFAILVNEIVIPQSIDSGFLRPAALSPFNLPAPYASWLYAFWQLPAANWSFALLQKLFMEKNTLPSMENAISGAESWFSAQENMLMHSQRDIYTINGMMHDCINRVASLEQVILELKKTITTNQAQRTSIDSNLQAHRNLTHQLASAERQLEASAVEIDQLESKDMMYINQITQLKADNARLNDYVQAILHSRSWRMTAWWRKLGQPMKLLINQPNSKKAIKFIVARATRFLNRRPRCKRCVLRILHVTGLYNLSRKFYLRCFPITSPETTVFSQDVVLNSYYDSTQRPPLVEEIYLKINK